jgi:hypothetical protein
VAHGCLFPSLIPALDVLRVKQLALVGLASAVRLAVSHINLAHIHVLMSFAFFAFSLSTDSG